MTYKRSSLEQLRLFSPLHPKGIPIDRYLIETRLGMVCAETWPARYKFHKYWGRKPANVVARYVEFFSEPGELVLDPFCGSGVTVLESVLLGRDGFGVDVNPVAVLMTRAMLSPPDPKVFKEAAKEVVRQARAAVEYLFRTKCGRCGSAFATVRSVGHVGDEAKEIRYQCEACGYSGKRPPDSNDRALLKGPIESLPFPDAEINFGWEMQKLRRGGVKFWSDLLTRRNLSAAAALRTAILQIEDVASREWLLLSLTAGLAQFTKMISDSSAAGGGPSWKINCYWLPSAWQELNPIWYFENRVAKSLAAVEELFGFVSSGAGTVVERDSRTIELADASVDYIFTDPPYGGEGIQYGELSSLWCLWLGVQQDLDSEIAFNPHRNFSQEHYAKGLRAVFSECFRVLKPGKWMTVTFANKDPIVWDALISACKNAGFMLVTAAPVKRSAPSLTETTMHTAPKADLILTFQKPGAKLGVQKKEDMAEYSLSAVLRRIVSVAEKPLSVHDIYDLVTIDWFSWFYENGQRGTSVKPTLANIETELKRQSIA